MLANMIYTHDKFNFMYNLYLLLTEYNARSIDAEAQHQNVNVLLIGKQKTYQTIAIAIKWRMRWHSLILYRPELVNAKLNRNMFRNK